MSNFFRSLPKHVKTAFICIFRHLAMSLSAISAVTVTLLLFSTFLMIAGNISLFTKNIEDDLRIHVVLQPDVVKQAELDNVQKDIEGIQGVKKVTFSDADHELELMIKEHGEDFKMYRGKENPLSNAFFVSVKDADTIAAISKQIEQLDHVKQTMYGGTSVPKMVSMVDSIRFGGMIFVILLTLLALFLISNSIKMTIYARNAEIAIMRNVGATNWYIKVPFMLEGILIGLLGAILPCIFTYFGYPYLYEMLGGQIVTSLFGLQPIYPFTLQICAALLGFGMLVGLIGSFLSTTKYLHWKR